MNRRSIETAVADHESLTRLRAGETLFREGEQPRGVYILHSGSVTLCFAAKNGEAKALRRSTAGHILGLSSVVMRRPHDCTAIAAEPCSVAFIEKTEFLRMLDESPSMWFSVLHVLSIDVNAAYDDMRALAAR